MAKLILSMDGLVLKEIALTKPRITIGRKPHNDIQIDNLAISGEHAAIATILNDSFLDDLNSTNGTYVNGQPIKKHFLQNNDVVELGKYRLKYLTEPATATPGECDKALEITPAEHPAETGAGASAAAQPEPAAEPAANADMGTQGPLGVITILNGANAGRQLDLAKTLTTLGKTVIQVAVITRRPQGYFITHVEGSSFPLLNGAELGTQPKPLFDRDLIELAGIKMQFSLKD